MTARPITAFSALFVPLAVGALIATACGSGQPASDAGSDDGAAVLADDGLEGELLVFAAASLTDALEAIAEGFEAEHPDLRVVLNLAGSQSLLAQLRQGAPADVFAPADTLRMDAAIADGLASDPVPIAGNRLQIAVEPGNPLDIGGPGDLAREDVVVVLPAPEVPAGRYAAEALRGADVEVSPSSLEADVRAVLSKVALGEADAGIVYRSDVVAAGGRVDGVSFPAADDVVATYPVAVTDDARHPAAASAFVEHLRSAAGQRVLEAHGFEPVS